MTYRFEDHSLGLDRIIKSNYREPEEVQEAMKRDPLVIHRAAMITHGVATEEECDAIVAEVKIEIEEAVEFARNSPFPEPGDLFEDMWATPV
jgi:pyruvate dehydrogenase E1 component alpha subunit